MNFLRTSRPLSLLIYLGWLCGAVIVLLGLLEVSIAAIAWLRPTPEQHESIEPLKELTTARSRIRLVPKQYKGATVHTDHEGWRVSAGRATVFDGYSESDFNVVIFGGSTIWGYGVDDDKTIPAQLQQLLSSQRSSGAQRLSIYGLGLPGYAIQQEIYLLVDTLRTGRRVDLAIFYDGVNETCESEPDLLQSIMREHFVETDLDYWKFRGAMELVNHYAVLVPENMYTVRAANWALRRLSPAAPAAPAPKPSMVRRHAQRCAAAYLANAQFANNLIRSWNGKTVFILQPTGPLMNGAERYAFPQTGLLPDWEIEFYRELYRDIKAGAPAAGIDLRDWSNILDDLISTGEHIFLDSHHLTARGNATVASRMSDLLRDRSH